MFLRLMLLGIVLFAVYKLMGGSLTLPKRKGTDQDRRDDDSEDALEECPSCSTYVTRKESFVFKGRYYCSRECLPE